MAKPAASSLDIEGAEERLLDHKGRINRVIPRLRAITSIPDNAKVLDIGAAQGQSVIALEKMGFQALGIEPVAKAREVAREIAKLEGTRTDAVIEGVAENIPLPDNSFHIVMASQVMEHVVDPDAVCAEVHRVLLPGGVFWFDTASRVHPVSQEIDIFPVFNWYPNFLRHRIMKWAVEKHPAMVGYTKTPGVHAYSPWGARKMLRRAGFEEVYDRWDLQLEEERQGLQRLTLKLIRLNFLIKIIADFIIPNCVYAAVKPRRG